MFSEPPHPGRQVFVLTPNNYDFPAGDVAIPADGHAGHGLPFDDLRAFMTAIYASPAGQLISFLPQTPGMSQTSLHTPNNGYAGLVNFFDPDNFFTVSALALSGDPYLLAEARPTQRSFHRVSACEARTLF